MGSCGVLPDPWHFFRSGEPWQLLRSLDPDQIAIIHADDAPAVIGDDLVYESRHRRLPIGAGTFAIAEFVSAIDTLGYDGVISAEVLSPTLREQEPGEGAHADERAQRALADQQLIKSLADRGSRAGIDRRSVWSSTIHSRDRKQSRRPRIRAPRAQSSRASSGRAANG